MRRLLIATAALALASGVALAAPKIVVDVELYDFGVASDGTVIRFPVTITNAGNENLVITRVSYNCSCTSYSLPKKEIAPGESVTMTITFNTANYSRYQQPVAQTVTVFTNDPTRGSVVITVRGTVRKLADQEAPAQTLHQSYYILVDLRPVEAYLQGHLLGAVNIPFAELPNHIGQLPRDKVIYLYDETGEKAAESVALLKRQGFFLARAIAGGLIGWWQELGDLFFVWAEGVVPQPFAGAAYPGAQDNAVSPTQVARNYLVLVDVRRPEEYAREHLAGAVNAPMFTQGELVAWAQKLPPERPGFALKLWIIDEDGSRACSIAAYLRDHGYPSSHCLLGGLLSWKSQYPGTLLWTETR